jgi:GNAT superfamily N-acetyltransferase
MSNIDCLPLSAAPDAVPALARWFKAQWPDYYAGRTLAEVGRDFPLAPTGALPLIYVALRDGDICGTAALREHSIRTFGHLGPWLGGLFVEPGSRRHGVASALAEAVATEARARGARSLYAGTVEAHALFDALGWRRVAETFQEGEAVTVYERAL